MMNHLHSFIDSLTSHALAGIDCLCFYGILATPGIEPLSTSPEFVTYTTHDHMNLHTIIANLLIFTTKV